MSISPRSLKKTKKPSFCCHKLRLMVYFFPFYDARLQQSIVASVYVFYTCGFFVIGDSNLDWSFFLFEISYYVATIKTALKPACPPSYFEVFFTSSNK